MFLKNKINKNITAIFAVCIFAAMLIYPDVSILSTKKAINLWINDIVPALLPFFIVSNFMINIGFTKIFSIPIFTYLMSILSGYPTGAKVIGELYDRGEIGTIEVYKLISFCSTTGLAFLIGTIGINLLEYKLAGYIIAASHYIASIINGLLYCKIISIIYEQTDTINKKNKRKIKSNIKSNNCVSEGVFKSLSKAILSSLQSMGIILAYIVIFLFITDIMTEFNLFNIFDKEVSVALTKGILEMSIGCFSLVEIQSINEITKIMILSFIVSFGGFSVAGQSMSMLSNVEIPLGYYLLTKLTHGLFAVIVSYLIVIILIV